MALAVVAAGVPTEIPPSGVAVIGDVHISYDSLSLWSEADRNAVGVYTIVDDVIPAGKVATGSTLEFATNQVKRHWTLADAPVPATVTRRQARLVLLAAAKLDAVEAAVAAASRDTQIWYQDAPMWERNNPIVIALAVQLGLSPETVDGMFKQAAVL